MTWAADLDSPNESTRHAAHRAITTLGSGAVPTLRRVVRRPDSLLATAALRLQRRWPGDLSRRLATWTQPYNAPLARGDALRALQVLGPTSVSAMPDVLALLTGPTNRIGGILERRLAQDTLGCWGAPALPALSNALATASDPADQMQLITSLTRVGPPAASALPLVLQTIDRLDNQPSDRLGVAFLRSLGPEAGPQFFNSLAPAQPNTNSPLPRVRLLGLVLAEDQAFRRRALDLFPIQPPPVQGLLAPALVQTRLEPRRVALTLARAFLTTDEPLNPAIGQWLKATAPAETLLVWFTNEPPQIRRRLETLLAHDAGQSSVARIPTLP
jgi:hypothetical protein